MGLRAWQTAGHPHARRGPVNVPMLLGPARRAELFWRRNATLGTIMHTLAGIHGDHRLVTERRGPR